MKDRKISTFVYEGFGFPIKLINVPMKKVFGKWAMDIDLNKLQLAILRYLLYKPARLNGDEVRFIRKFLNITTTDFGKIFGVSHVAVLKWEKGQNRIPPATDIYIRLHVLNYLHAKDKEFRGLYNTINPESLSKHEGKRISRISINIDEDLKTA